MLIPRMPDFFGGSPVFVREFRARMRKPWPFWLLFGYLAVLIPAALAFLYRFQSVSPEEAYLPGVDTLTVMRQYRETGLLFMLALFAFQFLLISLLTPALTCGTVATDRVKRTLLFTLLTPVSSREIVMGKLKVSLFAVFLTLVATLPLCVVGSLFGGIAPIELLAIYGVLLGYAWALGAFGVYVSAHARTSAIAALLTYLGVAAVPVLFPFTVAPYLGLYALREETARPLVVEALQNVGFLPVALALMLLFWLASEWFIGEAAAGLDYERRMWGTFAPPLPLEALQQAAPVVPDEEARRDHQQRRW